MTREELLVERITKITKSALGEDLNNMLGIEVNKDFNETILQASILAAKVGMNFADEHPHWISVEDELPPMRDMSRQSEAVLVLCAYTEKQMAYRERILYNPKKYCYRIGVYDYGVKGWFFEQVGEFTQTHWMPLPQPPLVTDLNKKDLPPLGRQEGNILVEEDGGEE